MTAQDLKVERICCCCTLLGLANTLAESEMAPYSVQYFWPYLYEPWSKVVPGNKVQFWTHPLSAVLQCWVLSSHWQATPSPSEQDNSRLFSLTTEVKPHRTLILGKMAVVSERSWKWTNGLWLGEFSEGVEKIITIESQVLIYIYFLSVCDFVKKKVILRYFCYKMIIKNTPWMLFTVKYTFNFIKSLIIKWISFKEIIQAFFQVVNLYGFCLRLKPWCRPVDCFIFSSIDESL